MRTVIQRVQHASVTIDGTLKSKIGKGGIRRKILNGFVRRYVICVSSTMKTVL